MSKKDALRFSAAERRSLLDRLDDYVASCHPPPGSDQKKNPGRLANIAGFCRYLGRAPSDLEALAHSHPSLYGRISAILEDELLNFTSSPTVLGAYMKKRLGYGGETEERQETDCGQVRLVFDHDIEEDGA